jgi:hypothetical protein
MLLANKTLYRIDSKIIEEGRPSTHDALFVVAHCVEEAISLWKQYMKNKKVLPYAKITGLNADIPEVIVEEFDDLPF